MNPAQANRNSTKILAIHPADEVARPLPLIPIFIITVCFFLRRSTYLGGLIVSPSPVRAGCGNVKAARAACGGVAHPAHRARRRTEMVMLTVWLDGPGVAVCGAVSRQHYAQGRRGGERASPRM